MSYGLRLHLEFIKLKIASRMNYRADFIISIIAFFFIQLLTPLFVAAIYYTGGKFPGWGLYEALLITGTFSLVRGFSSMMFMGIMWNTINHVRQGKLDLLLVKPMGVISHLVMSSYDEEDLGQFLGGLAVVVFAVVKLGGFSGSILAYLGLIVFGVIFFFGVSLLGSAAAIKYVNVWRAYEIIEIFTSFASYPKTVFSRGLVAILSTVLPLLILAYYPASVLLGVNTDILLVPMACVLLFMTFSYYVWQKTLKGYTGAGG